MTTAPPVDAPLRSYVDGDAWVCVFCTGRSPLTAPHCSTCGLSWRGGRPASYDAGGGVAWWRRTLPVPAEAGLALLLLLLWRLADVVAATRSAGAAGRGLRLWSLERSLGLPSERSLQTPLLAHAWLARLADGYYVLGHVPLMVVLGGWLLVRHRERYGAVRSAVVASTALCFLVQLVTVAPPRSVAATGVVDVAARRHESVYSARGLADPVASFPSVHVLWALVAAGAVLAVVRGPWRWLAVLHPVATAVAVVATGNHYWLDVLAAVPVAAGALAVLRPDQRVRQAEQLRH